MINNSEVINMSKNSNATIIEFLIDDTQGCFFKNTFKYINIEEHASLNYYFINKKESKNFFYDFSKIKLSKDQILKNIYFLLELNLTNLKIILN